MIRSVTSSILALALFLVALVIAPASGAAHEFDPERQVLVQVFPSHIDVVISYTEAPGPRSDFFSSLFLRVSPELAGRAVLPRLLDGLQFEVPGESPRTGEPEVRVRTIDARVVAVAHVRYDLDALDEDATRTLIVRAADRSFLTTEVLIYSGGDLSRVDAPEERTPLYRGGELRGLFRFAAP